MKLNRYHVIIIGVVVCAIAVVGIYMGPIKNKNVQIAAQQQAYNDAYQTYSRLPQAEAAKANAEAELKLQERKLAQYMNSRMPEIALTDRVNGMIAFWRECSDVMGPTLERFPMSRPGVTGISGIRVQAPSTDPNDIKAEPVVLDLGEVNVRVKNFRTALGFFKEMKKCPRLVSISSVKLSGPPSPDLSMSVKLTAYIFPTAGLNTPPIAGGGAASADQGGMSGAGMMPMPGGVAPGGPGGVAPGGPGGSGDAPMP